MGRVREQIDGCDRTSAVAEFVEQLDVARARGWIARHEHDSFGVARVDRPHAVTAEPGTARIGDHDVDAFGPEARRVGAHNLRGDVTQVHARVCDRGAVALDGKDGTG